MSHCRGISLCQWLMGTKTTEELFLLALIVHVCGDHSFFSLLGNNFLKKIYVGERGEEVYQCPWKD